jgi:hypothetical protein
LDVETMKDCFTKVKVKTRPMPLARPETKRHCEGAQRPLRCAQGRLRNLKTSEVTVLAMTILM